MTTGSGALSALLMMWCLTPYSGAQYREHTPQRISDRFVHAGFFAQRFEPRSSNAQADSLRIAYRRLMPTLGFRQGLVDVTVGYTRFPLHGQDKAALFVGLSVGHEMPITQSAANGLFVRLSVSSDYTRAESSGGDKESFVIGSAGIGAGMVYRLRHRGFELSLAASEALHGSFQTFSTGMGFSAATMGEALVQLREALLFDGIAMGYRFRYQTWSMNNKKFDYKTLAHGAFIGVMF